MITYEFDPELVNKKIQLFPDAIDNDPWVVYHGTSNINESKIENYGFEWNSLLYTKEEIENIIKIYEKMDWSGSDTGGFVVLKGYSYDHDFKKGTTKPIYFAESSYRALTYARKEFSGGETARAVRKSIEDLEKYLVDKNVRESAMKYRMNNYNFLIANNVLNPELPIEIDLTWLQKEVNKLQDIKNKCYQALDKFQYGIVYAVKFSLEDLNINFEYHNSMGLKIFSPISKNKIVGKVHIPINFSVRLLTDRKRVYEKSNDGIIGRLVRKKNEL